MSALACTHPRLHTHTCIHSAAGLLLAVTLLTPATARRAPSAAPPKRASRRRRRRRCRACLRPLVATKPAVARTTAAVSGVACNPMCGVFSELGRCTMAAGGCLTRPLTSQAARSLPPQPALLPGQHLAQRRAFFQLHAVTQPQAPIILTLQAARSRAAAAAPARTARQTAPSASASASRPTPALPRSSAGPSQMVGSWMDTHLLQRF